MLILNAIKTPDGTLLISKHRHDFVTHKDLNGKTYMVDGGLEYSRRSCNGDERDYCLYNDQPHRVQRAVLLWGTFGKDGNQPYKRLRIMDMDTSHIEACLETQHRMSHVYRACMEKELQYRKLILDFQKTMC